MAIVRKAFHWQICTKNAKVRPRCLRLCSFSLRVCPSPSNIDACVALECPKCRKSRKHPKPQFYLHQTEVRSRPGWNAGALLGPNNHPVDPLCAQKTVRIPVRFAYWTILDHSHEVEDYFKQSLCRFSAKTCKHQFSQCKTHIVGVNLPRLIALFVTLLVQNSLREPLLSSSRRLCGYCPKGIRLANM